MTVIAYRDGVMAGDSLWTNTDQHGLVGSIQTKLCRLRSGALYGGAGSADDRELRESLEDVVTEAQFPKAKELTTMEQKGVEALLILPDGSVWIAYTAEHGTDKGGGVEPVSLPYFAVGVGAPVAIGAMAHGATAIEAVKIACDHNANCRPPVTHLKLKG